MADVSRDGKDRVSLASQIIDKHWKGRTEKRSVKNSELIKDNINNLDAIHYAAELSSLYRKPGVFAWSLQSCPH